MIDSEQQITTNDDIFVNKNRKVNSTVEEQEQEVEESLGSGSKFKCLLSNRSLSKIRNR